MMPPVSQAQRRLFRWAEENPKEAAARGIKPGIAKEFNAADPGGKLPAKVEGGKPVSAAERRYARKSKA
jgi:hypothetical protein